MTHALLRTARRSLAVLLVLGACTRARPAADSAAADSATPPTPDSVPAPADSAVRAPAPATGSPAGGPVPAKPLPADSPPPRLTPRPPRPVPRPMPRDTSAATGGTQASDQAAIDRLVREAKALARTDGCAAAEQCAVQPLGVRACGGPEDFVVYCPRSTDVAALRRKAAELERAQKAFNARYEIVSTCELRQAPRAALVGGSCRAASSGAPAPQDR